MKVQILDSEKYQDKISEFDDFLDENKIKYEAAHVKEWETEDCDGSCCDCTPCEDDDNSDNSEHLCSGHDYSFYVVEYEISDKLSKRKQKKLDDLISKSYHIIRTE